MLAARSLLVLAFCVSDAVGGLGFATLSPRFTTSRAGGSLCRMPPPSTRHRHCQVAKLKGCTEKAASAVVLDFDGVICDCSEAARIAYRTALRKWPETMQQSKGIGPREAGVRSSWVGYQWSEYEEDSGDDIPRWLEEKLKQVRPVTSGPADFVLAARLCVSEALAGRNHKRSGRRPLTAGEIIENWVEMKDVLYMRCNTTVEELEKMFIEERRAWMDTDRDGWSQSATIYPPVADALKQGRDKVYYLTSDFDVDQAKLVLECNGVEVPEGRIIEVEGESKADALHSVVGGIEGGVAYVEDDAPTLQSMAGDLRFADGVSLHFATWGHSTSKNKAAVAAWPRVHSLEVDALSDLMVPEP